MPSEKRLNSVCHSIAHHAVSGLSYVHPHLRRACNAAGLVSVAIDLGIEEPCPVQFQTIESLRHSLRVLREKFIEILRSEGFGEKDVKEIKLHFEFTREFPDDYCSNCHAYLVSQSGKEFWYAVNYLGDTIAPNKALQPTPKIGAAEL